MSTKHTPGPWRVSDTSIVTEKHCIAVIETDGGYECEPVEQKANAQLIATAPALLEALRDLVGIICSMPGYPERDVTIDDCDTAKAAIAAAEGGR